MQTRLIALALFLFPAVAGAAAFTGYTLVNAKTGQAIRPLRDGDTIDLKQVTVPISIRFETSGTVGSIRIRYDGKTQIENNTPWSMTGNPTSNTYGPWNPTVGDHPIVATIFPRDNAQGTAGPSANFTIKVIA